MEQQAVDRERWAEERARLDTVGRLLKMGFSNVDIAQGVGVDLDIVLKVYEQMNDKSAAEVWTVEQQAIDHERWAREEEKLAIAKNLINSGVSTAIIASSTKLSEAEILKLKSEL